MTLCKHPLFSDSDRKGASALNFEKGVTFAGMNITGWKLTFILLWLTLTSRGQTPDSLRSLLMIRPHYGAGLSLADLHDRFGHHFNPGASISWLSKKNLFLGIQYDYFFGNQVKEDVLSHLRTIEGGIIGSDMQFASVALRERGQALSTDLGYFVRLPGSQARSGFLVTAGAAYLRHKIRIVDDYDSVIQLRDPYNKGYDRLTEGYGLTQGISYVFLARDKMINFSLGIRLMEAFTKDQRQYNYDQSPLKSRRLDILAGLQLGWVLPVYLTPETRYY
jgi:hypothetical protein